MNQAHLFTDRKHGLFTDHDYWTMHDGEEIRFNLEDYQPYEPQSCLYEAYLFCDVTVDGKPVTPESLTAAQNSAMIEAYEEEKRNMQDEY